MRTRPLILIIMFFSFGCKQNDSFFPDKKTVLTPEFSGFDNFFPIATLNDLRKKGIKDKIHIMYVSFDSNLDHNKSFPDHSNVDGFTFSILDNGLYQPRFEKSALVIGKGFEEYFKEGQKKYFQAKSGGPLLAINQIDIIDQPEWWQDDETPLNSKGLKMKFICQVDMYELVDDDCRLYVFYDQEDRIVKYIYQRT